MYVQLRGVVPNALHGTRRTAAPARRATAVHAQQSKNARGKPGFKYDGAMQRWVRDDRLAMVRARWPMGDHVPKTSMGAAVLWTSKGARRGAGWRRTTTTRSSIPRCSPSPVVPTRYGRWCTPSSWTTSSRALNPRRFLTQAQGLVSLVSLVVGGRIARGWTTAPLPPSQHHAPPQRAILTWSRALFSSAGDCLAEEGRHPHRRTRGTSVQQGASPRRSRLPAPLPNHLC